MSIRTFRHSSYIWTSLSGLGNGDTCRTVLMQMLRQDLDANGQNARADSHSGSKAQGWPGTFVLLPKRVTFGDVPASSGIMSADIRWQDRVSVGITPLITDHE